MEIEKSNMWQRRQLATVERIQRDLARYTHPVIRAVGLCGVAYLASWAVVMVQGAVCRVDGGRGGECLRLLWCLVLRPLPWRLGWSGICGGGWRGISG